MRLYHRTPHGEAIIASGVLLPAHTHNNADDEVVWFSDTIEGTDSGARGDWLVVLDLPDDLAVTLKDDPMPHFPYGVPVDVANSHPWHIEKWRSSEP